MLKLLEVPLGVATVAEFNCSSIPAAVRGRTYNPPRVASKLFCSAACPTVCHWLVPFKNDTMICAVGWLAEVMSAMPFASAEHKPAREINPPPSTWQYGTTRVLPG